MLKRLDGFLLGVAQRFCDKFQRFTGLTKFKLQKWAVISSVISGWGATAFLGFPSISVLSGLMNTAAWSFNIWIDEKTEAEFLANGNLVSSLMDSISVRLAFVCILGGLGIFSILVDAGIGGMLFCQAMFLIAYVYFSACIPRPPSKSKMQEWYEKVLTALNESLKPEPALVPIPVVAR